MKIIIFNTEEKKGGAAIAANRLMSALQKEDIDVKMLVREKTSDNKNVISLSESFFTSRLNKFRFLWERFVIFFINRFSRFNLFNISIANTGINISKLPVVKDADIIHLHWVNQGFLSLKDLKKLILLGKPIIWTLHDQWAYTSICHYTSGCEKFIEHCSNCHKLKYPGKKDISHDVFVKKAELYKNQNITLVGCSQWIAGLAKKSELCKRMNITSIPNPIDVSIYHKKDKKELRKQLGLSSEGKLVLFGSCKVTDKRKGVDYLKAACDLLLQQNKFRYDELSIVVFGGNSDELSSIIPYKVFNLGYINNVESIVDLYSAVDLFLVPSLEDNLPNTIMESMACGTPCVGFEIGGIPEMIDHKENGYVAKYKSAEDLAEGIIWVLNNENPEVLSQKARDKVLNTYSEDKVANQYIKLYNTVLKNEQ